MGGSEGLRAAGVVLDCPDPAVLAEFYAALLGWPGEPIINDDGQWVVLHNPAGGLRLEFQQAQEYHAPTWPDPQRPQMFHLDVTVRDLDAARAEVLARGATVLDISATHPSFRVFADPAGHPFCLCAS